DGPFASVAPSGRTGCWRPRDPGLAPGAMFRRRFAAALARRPSPSVRALASDRPFGANRMLAAAGPRARARGYVPASLRGFAGGAASYLHGVSGCIANARNRVPRGHEKKSREAGARFPALFI